MKEQEVKGSSQAGAAIKEEASFLLAELVDYLITDVATEAHRAARLGFDYRLDVEEEEDARSLDKERDDAGDAGFSGADSGSSKYTVDVFGQTHPAIATDAFDCMNCGRSIVAGRFAPHLEKCMGKGRRARLKTVKNNIQVPQQKRSRSSPSSSHGTALVPLGSIGNRSYNKLQMQKEAQRVAELNDETSDEAHEDEDKDVSYGQAHHPVKSRSRKRPAAIWTLDRGGDGGGGGGGKGAHQQAFSPLVPVTVNMSPPTKPWNSSSCSTLQDTAMRAESGTVQGLAVEVDVETTNPVVSLRFSTSIHEPPLRISRVGMVQRRANRGSR